MLKPFEIHVYSEKMNALLTFTDILEAYEVYEQLRKSGKYFDGDLSDNTTGEIHAYFNHHKDAYGKDSNNWISADLDLMLLLAEVSST